MSKNSLYMYMLLNETEMVSKVTINQCNARYVRFVCNKLAGLGPSLMLVMYRIHNYRFSTIETSSN